MLRTVVLLLGVATASALVPTGRPRVGPATALTPRNSGTCLRSTNSRATQPMLVVYPPDNHHREACRLVGNLKGNAALLAAFSFAAATRSDLPEATAPALQDAYVIATTATLALNLVAVFVGQQLLYRMGDGSFGTQLENGSIDPDRTVLGIMLANYREDFITVRFCFLTGVCTMMIAIGLRAWIVYEPFLASVVTLIFASAGGVMAYNARRTEEKFERVRFFDAATQRETFGEVDENGAARSYRLPVFTRTLLRTPHEVFDRL